MAKIIIIGGGIAGITAAKQLLDNSFQNVVILEAKGNIGGRICTKDYGDHVLEMGAQWIHGEDGNMVYDFAYKHGLTLKGGQTVCEGTDVEDKCFQSYFFTPHGRLIDHDLVDETILLLDNVFNDVDQFFNEYDPNCRQSVLDYTLPKFHLHLNGMNQSEEVKHLMKGLFHWRCQFEHSDNSCNSLQDIPVTLWSAYQECPGEYLIPLKNGFSKVLEILSTDIPKENLLLNHPVKCVHWGNNTENAFKHSFLNENAQVEETSKSPVLVEIVDGSVIAADHVIITCSLGTLKQRGDTMFQPNLPQNKRISIQKLGYGTVDKIYLEFEECFWESDCAGIQLVWASGEDISLTCVETDETNQWWKGIHGFNAVQFHPNLLCGWIAGEEAVIMEQQTDKAVLDICHELLQNFVKGKNIPKPNKITRTKWGSDPFTCGSYTFCKMGCTLRDFDILAEPLPNKQEPRVLFAGEATHRKHFSTTHGALESGIREADRIIQYYTNLKQKDHLSTENSAVESGIREPNNVM